MVVIVSLDDPLFRAARAAIRHTHRSIAEYRFAQAEREKRGLERQLRWAFVRLMKARRQLEVEGVDSDEFC